MENQHRKITGYRELSQEEVNLMNMIKAEGAVLSRLIEGVYAHLNAQSRESESTEEERRIREAEPNRWAAIAKTHFQEGLMALTRAVAQPGSF